jgi:hypothetical protein
MSVNSNSPTANQQNMNKTSYLKHIFIYCRCRCHRFLTFTFENLREFFVKFLNPDVENHLSD